MSNEKKNQTEEQSRLPAWFEELSLKCKADIAHEFIVHGYISDPIPNPDADDEPDRKYISFRRFLEKIFDERSMVVFYNISAGIRFLNSQMETRFREISEMDSEADAQSPLAAAAAALSKKRGIPREPETCLPLIEKALTRSEKVAVVISYAHAIAPAGTAGGALSVNDRINTVRLASWARNEAIKRNKNIILLLTDELAHISSELRASGSGIQTVFVPKPSKEERKAFLRAITEEDGEYRLPKDFDLDIFAHNAQGLSYQQILDIFLQSKAKNEEISLKYVKKKKEEILNNEYRGIMKVCEAKRGPEDIGDLEHLKEYFREISEAIKKGERRLVPMGINLYGPPGTGKTLLVEALAKEADFNFVKIENVRSMYVGASEEKMLKLIYGLYSLAPVVVNNDEADLGEADRNAPKGDSGVSERIMKEWMELLSDPKIRGNIIVISCTNRPDRIDPALKRSGRSDERIFVPMPSEEARAAIFKVVSKTDEIPNSISDFSEFAKMTDNLSGADIGTITHNAFRFAFSRGKKKVDEAVLKEAVEDFIPSASQREIDMMSLMAILESSSRRLLPPHIKEIIAGIKSRNLVPNLEQILAQIKARNIAEID